MQNADSSALEAAYAAACDQAAACPVAPAPGALVSLRGRLPQPSASLELQLGHAQLRLGELAEARASLEAALALDPALFHAHLFLAHLRAEAGDAAGTEASLREAERLAPPDAA